MAILHENALSEFARFCPQLEQAKQEVLNQLSVCLSGEKVETHSITGRVKGHESLRRKLSRPDKTYHSLWDVTDLMAIRVVTYFEDTIQKIAQIVEANFAVSFHLSNDRLKVQDHGNFGYRSLHYICAWTQSEGGVPREFRFEIQLRTILQHAWAEIEHDLGYKASDSTPLSIRRRFSRIAGLLEIADDEFVSIKKDLATYTTSVEQAMLKPNSSVPLDLVSLHALVDCGEVKDLDARLASTLGKPKSEAVFFPQYLLRLLLLAGYLDTLEIRNDLSRLAEDLLGIVPKYFEFAQSEWKLTAQMLESIPRGYSLFFLAHLAILKSPILEENKVHKLAHLYRELDYPHDEAKAYSVAQGLFKLLGAV